MSLIKCSECGKEYSNNADSCPNCGNPTQRKKSTVDVQIVNSTPKWSIVKLIVGIISIVLFMLISLQSCASGVLEAVTSSDTDAAGSGFGCAFFTMIAGIIVIASRKSYSKAGPIAAIILYVWASILTAGTGNIYPDLPVWGSIVFCFAIMLLASIIANTKYFASQGKQKALIVVTVVLCMFVFISSFNNYPVSSTKSDNNSNPSTNSSNSKSSAKEKKYGLNNKFRFDGLEIEIGKDIQYEIVNNSFSEYNGQTAVKIPITVKNLKEESYGLNMFYYNVYGSKGTQTKNLSSYFDENIDFAGDLRPGAQYTKYMFFLYDGNGNYAIEFKNWTEKVIVEFNITK